MEQFTYVKRGYDPEEVDRYIATLEQVIKSYKEKDNAIKNAIISAQVAADNMVKNAKMQADEYKGQIAKELDKVSLEVDRQRMRIQAFKDVYSGLVKKYLTDLDEDDMTDIFARLDDVEKLIGRLKEVDIVPAPTPGDFPIRSSAPPEPSTTPPAPTIPPPTQGLNPAQSAGTNPPPRPAPVPPKPPAPMLSLGPNSSPSLNKTPGGAQKPGYAPPQVVARINEDGNYVPSP